MNLPPQTSNGTANERRAVPRHIRDGEHGPLHEAGELSPGPRTRRRRPRLWMILAVVAALIAGLWFYTGTRG